MLDVMQLRLHTRYQNSAGERVRIVLNLKGIAYEYVAIPSLSGADYRRINPQGLMPALDANVEAAASMKGIVDKDRDEFMRIRKDEGLNAAIAWRTARVGVQ